MSYGSKKDKRSIYEPTYLINNLPSTYVYILKRVHVLNHLVFGEPNYNNRKWVMRFDRGLILYKGVK